MRRFRKPLWAILVAPFLLFGAPPAARAHRDDYLDETLVYLTLHRHELEPEYWIDFGRLSDGGYGLTHHHFAAEYGITEHWMVEGRGTIETRKAREPGFETGRIETRYRFSEEGNLPVDIAVSGEINTARDEIGRREIGAELRLILSKDFGKSNLTLNLAQELPLHRGASEFIPALGFRHETTRLVYLGSEVKYNVEEHQGAVIPQVWFRLPHEATIKVGYGAGFGHEHRSFARVAIEVEF